MIEGKKVLALVPARSGSKGLPDKNIRVLGGRPLLGWPIKTALESEYIDRVIVSTDSEHYAEKATEQGADVPFIRPEALSNDAASSFSFIQHALEFLQQQGESYDYLVLLEPTSPLTEPKDVDVALDLLVSRREDADAVVSVAEVVKNHPEFVVSLSDNSLMLPYLDKIQASRRQDVEKLYSLDGSFYISAVPALLKNKGFYHDRTLAQVMPYYKSFEIDDLVDFICVEALHLKKDLFR